MPVEVRESYASATGTEVGGDRVYTSIQAAIDDFVSTQSPSSVDFVDTEKIGHNRVAVVIGYTA
jgi:hypothetical protein